nr:glycosyltransferase family 2 protein [uncultured Oscillibacter sp.]
MEKKPVLSIGMIFKNETRCLERCLESLRPLREAVPCELIMADTGSTDGSREIAARYADDLFDFPWVNDFSAARNAVMDRASGEWYLSIDADEWLDPDVRQLRRLFKEGRKLGAEAAVLVVRNYKGDLQDGAYTDVFIPRVLRMDTGMRFAGAIHESWPVTNQNKLEALTETILHHDGYSRLGAEIEEEKRVRNVTLLHQELEKEPDRLLTLLQYIESGQKEEDYDEVLRRAVALVEKRAKGWERCGAPILRYGVMSAQGRDYPELERWLALAEERFPDSFFTLIDAQGAAFDHSWQKGDYADCIRRGETALKAIADYNAGRGDQLTKLTSAILLAAPQQEAYLRLFMAGAHIELGHPEEALALLGQLDGAELKPHRVENFMAVLQRAHAMTAGDDGALVLRFWERIGLPQPSEDRARERREAFTKVAAGCFDPAYLQKEQRDGAPRPAYTLYEPLAGQCEVGTAAAVLAAGSVPEMAELLARVENWAALPPLALEKALLSGVCFPLAERPLNLEEMDALASGLAQDPGTLHKLLNEAAGEDYAGSWQTLSWTRALALAAVQSFGWKNGGQEGLALARTFAKVEGAFLTGCYAPEVLREGNLLVLPPMHRFGWYCAQAFNALEAGDSMGYTRLLRAGLETNPAMKPVVEYLAEHTPELEDTGASPELLALAEKVRTMLAAYPADDPAVAALKASPAYQRVAYLIEGDRG